MQVYSNRHHIKIISLIITILHQYTNCDFYCTIFHTATFGIIELYP